MSSDYVTRLRAEPRTTGRVGHQGPDTNRLSLKSRLRRQRGPPAGSATVIVVPSPSVESTRIDPPLWETMP
jgi:hypothetical protein